MSIIKKVVNPFINLFKKTPTESAKSIFRKDNLGVELRDVVWNMYHNKDDINGFVKDKDLSNKNQQVYFNPESNKLLMSVAGTHNIKDVGTDFQLIGGQIKNTSRYREADKTLKNAKDKYDTNATVVGHSLGSSVASRIASKDDRVINYNPAYIGGKDRSNTTNIRNSGDIISVFGANSSYSFGIPLSIANPLNWLNNHTSNSLKGQNLFI